MLELLPGIGVVLPDGAGTLRFGMTSGEVAAVLAGTPRSHRARQCMTLRRTDYTQLRHAHDAWLRGVLFDPAWNTVAVLDDVLLTVAGGGPGGGPGGADRLTQVVVEATGPVTAPAAHAVAWDGVDLFGHPAPDVASVLPAPARPSGPTAAGGNEADAADDLTVPALGLWLRRHPKAPDRWSQLTLLATPTGWERCCAGAFACADGGDGLVGVLR
ncbi:hypothetical protein ACFCX4_33235 [Kitasatospora sp. NPDC056327]|uniref:hypothetical protein n=1 Tax=Kitasatospora sp. NPDC056327 TaxID=3345785 RepID=UPI0035D6A079